MADGRPRPAEDRIARKRAALALAGMAAAAGIVAAVMIAFLHTTGHPNHSGLPGFSSGPTTSAAPKPRSTSAQPTQSPSSTPSATVVTTTCPSTAPCALSGDGGNLVAAINAFRAAHGKSPVTGATSKAAQKCAVGSGDESSCPADYSWEPVSKLDGVAAVIKIANNDGGSSWLLDAHTTSVAVGWAFIPGRGHGAGTYECAVFKHDK